MSIAPDEIASRKGSRIKAYRKTVLGLLQFVAGLYELITGEEAPKISNILRG